MACSSLGNLLKSRLTHHGSTVHRAVRYLSSSSKPKVSQLSILPLTKTPWLMLPSDVKDGPNGPTDNYFNILDRRLVKIDRHKPDDLVPIPKDTTCIGATRGWVAFASDTHNCTYVACPYIHWFTNEFPGFKNRYTNGFHCSLSSDPFSNDIKLVRLYRLGGPAGPFSPRSISPVLAAAIWNNRIVYNLEWVKQSAELKIYYFDVTSKHPFQVAGDFCFADQVVDGQRLLSSIMNQDSNAMKAYLVVEDGSKSEEKPELLLVITHLGETPAKTQNIDLIRIDLERKKLECVKSIGDRMIFVGENSEPFILSTRDCPGLKSNSVYIAEDLGYYDLETKCVTRFLWLGDLDNFRPQACWVAPQSSTFLLNSSDFDFSLS